MVLSVFLLNVSLNNECIIIPDQCLLLVLPIVELIATKSGLINEEVCDSLSFKYGFSAVVDLGLLCHVDVELNFLKTEGEAPDWVEDTLNSCYELKILISSGIVEGKDGGQNSG